jgi:hypothetical protein
MAGDAIDVVARTYHTEENTVVHLEGETYSVTDRARAETLRGIGFVSIDGWTDAAPGTAPVLASLTPATAALGAANFSLHVLGSGFTATDVVHWDGAPVPTTFVSATELSTPIDMTTVTVAGLIPVTVQAGALVSNALTFTVTAT